MPAFKGYNHREQQAVQQAVTLASQRLSEIHIKSVCKELLQTLGMTSDEADEAEPSTGTEMEAGTEEDFDEISQVAGTIQNPPTCEEESWWEEAAARAPLM